MGHAAAVARRYPQSIMVRFASEGS